MRIITMISMTLVMISCIGHGNSTDKIAAGVAADKKDSLIYY